MLLQDIKYAVRSLVLDRGVTVIVILCLALGIGINATLFSVIDGVLIQSLPFAEADRLVVLNETFERGGIREGGVSYQDLQDWKAADHRVLRRSPRSAAAASRCRMARKPNASQGAAVTWDLFPTLGVPPALGRHLQRGRRSRRRRAGRDPQRRRLAPPLQRRSRHHRAQRHRQRPASHRRRRDAARSSAFLKTRRSGFRWRRSPRRIRATNRNLFTFGRMKPGVDLAQARADMASMAATHRGAVPGHQRRLERHSAAARTTNSFPTTCAWCC